MSEKHILLVCNPAQPYAAQTAQTLARFLKEKGQPVILSDYKEIARYPKACLCISLGGDGTVLRCARQTAPLKIPVLPVNCGHLGFLSACEAEQAENCLEQFFAGKYQLHTRWLLEADILRQEQPDVLQALAFNDCVIKATMPRAFVLHARQNDSLLKSFYGDGVIIATPTGSTAYSLAAGGPILEPNLNLWTITPICPHSLTDRTLILNADTTLTFTPQLKTTMDQAAVSLDGQENFLLQNGDQVIIRQSTAKVQLITTSAYDFFAKLQQKLEWGIR